MEYKKQTTSKIAPRLIIHGGAGNILPANLPAEQYAQFHTALLGILANTRTYQLAGHSALDTVTYAVTQLENNALFNCGHGAVFTRDGINELEASVMVSKGFKKRGVGVMGLRHVKNPIRLAREMLVRGEDDLEGGNGEHRGPMFSEEESALGKSSGAQGHDQMFGEGAEKLAKQWGIEIVDEKYFFVQTRWDEHVKGLEREREGGQAGYCSVEFVPQGTCGACAMDEDGVCAVATSTGGMTNKLGGRIGDTPTLGAGFWAEEWDEKTKGNEMLSLIQSPLEVLASCLSLATSDAHETMSKSKDTVTRSTAMSGTGNGESFLRMNAVRTASAIARYRGDSLRNAMEEITGPDGELQKSAGNRWKKTGEGEGGIIGIESTIVRNEHGELVSAHSEIVDSYNCGGMFRAYVDANGKAVCRVWRDGQYDGEERYEGEAGAYTVASLTSEKLPVF